MRYNMRRIMSKVAQRIVYPINHIAYENFFDFPFGKTPRADEATYLSIWNKEKVKRYAVIDEYEEKLGFSIDQVWFHELALLTQVVIKTSPICYQHGRLLYSSLLGYLANASNKIITILETGTARGFSSLCMAKALQDAGHDGRIITLDILPHNTKMYWNCINDEKGPKSRAELLENYNILMEDYLLFIQGDTKFELMKLGLARIHFAFLDGAHTYEDVVNEFNFVRILQKKGDVVFFDDYSPKHFPDVVRAINDICVSYGYSIEIITVNENRGYVIAKKK